MQRSSLKQKELFSESSSGESIGRQSFEQDSSYGDEHHVMMLIKQTQDGELQAQEDCLEMLGVNQYPISFICILGDVYDKYGKVANQICEAKGSGFLSQSVRGNEGIWVYTKPFFNAKNNNVIYFLLAKQSQPQPLSAKILALVTLISGSIIYVTGSELDSKCFGMMRSLTELQEYIIFASKHEELELPQLMPSFNWLLIGQKRSDETKNLLQDYLNSGQDIVKRSVKGLFLKRQTYFVQCSDIKNFSQSASAKIGQIKRKILVNTEGKSIKDQKVESGSIGAVLIETLTDNINTKGVVTLNQVWQQINDITSKTAYEQAVAQYIQTFEQNFDRDEPKGEQLYDLLKQMRQTTIQQFDRNTARQHAQKERIKLLSFLQSYQKSIVQANMNTCEMHNLKILKRITVSIEQNIRNGRYQTKQVFYTDFDHFVNQYKNQSKGPRKQQLLNQFLGQFKGSFEKMIGKPMQNSGSANFPLVHYDSQSGQNNLVFSLGNPSLMRGNSTVKNRELQNEIEELKQKLQAKQLKNSIVRKKQQERLQLQNQKIRQQMAAMNTQQRPKTQKCCLLF